MGIKHTFVSGVSDTSDTAAVRPSNWNADHTIDGDVDFGGHAILNADLTVVSASQYSLPGVWYDIRDYGDISSGNITTALQATIDAIGAGGRLKTIMIPQVEAVSTMTQGSITLPAPSGDPGWTLLYACKRIQFTSTLSLPASTTIAGRFGAGSRGNGTGALGPNGAHIVGDSIAAGRAVIDIVDVGSCRLENLNIEPGGGASYSLNFHRSAGLLVIDCSMGGGTGQNVSHTPYIGLQPAVLINGSFWSDWQNCRFGVGNDGGTSPAVWFISDVPTSDVGGGLAHFQNITTAGGGFKIGPFTYGPNAGNIHIDGLVYENSPAGIHSIVEIDASGGPPIKGCTFRRLEGADSIGTLYTFKNTAAGTSSIEFYECGQFDMDPASVGVNGLKIVGGQSAAAGGNASGTTIYPTYAEYTRDFPNTLDQRLVAAPRAPQWIMGTVLNAKQDATTWTNQSTGIVITAGKLAPDGTTNAYQVGGDSFQDSAHAYRADHTVSVGDWFIFGCWMQRVDDLELDIAGAGVLQYNLIYQGVSTGTETRGASGKVFQSEDISELDGAWHWNCVATKILTIGTNPCSVRLLAQPSEHTLNYFNPCIQWIPVATAPVDQDVINYTRSLKGGWAPQVTVAAQGQVGILDHQSLRGGLLLPALTFATLPASPIAGMQRYITNSNTATWGATAAGGGANKVMVWYNGTNWTVMGA